MENEGDQPAGGGGGGAGSARPQVPQMSLYERQAVQALQALQRQPNAAAQYLQQMYAAQHQQLMLQQHLSTAQLQQVTLAANRQVTPGSSSGEAQGSGAAQSTVNLSSTAVSQASARPQAVSSPATSVLLGPSSPSLSPSQAKMYLQAQVVARTLTRSAPLTHQLILMPGGSVATVQSDLAPATSVAHSDTDQAQNLAVRTQAQLQLPAAPKAPPTTTLTVSPSSSLNLSQSSSGQPPASAKAQGEGEAGAKKSEAEGSASTPGGGINLARTLTPAGHTLISSAATYTQIQPHTLLHQQLQQNKLVIQQQHLAIHQQHRQSQLAQLHLSQAPSAPHAQTLVVQPLSQAPVQKQAPPQVEAQKAVQAEPLKQAPAQPEAQAPPEGQKQGLKQVQAQPEALKLVPAQPEALAQSEAQKPTLKQAPAQTEASKQAQTQLEPPKQVQAPAEACSAPQKQATAEICPRQALGKALPVKAQATAPSSSTASSSCSASLPAITKPASGLGVVTAGQGQGLASSSGTPAPSSSPAPVLQSSASTQTPVSGLSPQAQDWAQPPPEPGCPQLHLPLKSAVKRKAEDEEEEVEFPNLGPPELSPNLSSGQDLKQSSAGKTDSIHSGPPVLTSVNSLLKVNRHVGDSKPPQAIVKPHILTHVIEGFVIQEGAEPFPVDSARDQGNAKQKTQEPPVLQPETQISSPHPETENVQPPGSEVGGRCSGVSSAGAWNRRTSSRGQSASAPWPVPRGTTSAVGKVYDVSPVERVDPMPKEAVTRLARRSSRRESGEVLRPPLHKRLAKGLEESGRASDLSGYEEATPPRGAGGSELGGSRRGAGDRESGPLDGATGPRVHLLAA
ncbi:polyhomeotic-like protein 1, partial [Hypanus sabinus]|uniref:polyhomeotic-like protein 1 n=1 Tax=Hypanus sabinus TaxID=79690 RepID=UPI0028C40055